MRLFAGSARLFFSEETPKIVSPLYFGNGPWSCINQYCQHYNMPCISYCRRKLCHSTKTFVGEFECLHCGMTYIHRCNIDSGAIVEKYKVKKRGDVWKRGYLDSVQKNQVQKSVGRSKYYQQSQGTVSLNVRKERQNLSWFRSVINLYQLMKNYNEVARELNINNRLVKKIVEYYEANGRSVEAFKALSYCDEHTSWKLENLKSKILELLHNNPEWNRTRLMSSIGQNSYDFLLKADNDWAEEYLPPKQMK